MVTVVFHTMKQAEAFSDWLGTLEDSGDRPWFTDISITSGGGNFELSAEISEVSSIWEEELNSVAIAFSAGWLAHEKAGTE